MSLQAVSTVQPKRTNNTSLIASAGVGAALGAGARYILPTKDELKSVDTFVSSAALSARGANRSIMKYGAIGAIIASGLSLLNQVFKEQKNDGSIEYTKLGALIDAPDYACEIMWYGE